MGFLYFVTQFWTLWKTSNETISVHALGMKFFKMCKWKHLPTCYLNQCVLKHLLFSLMLCCSVSHRTTFWKTFNFFGQRLEHSMSYIDNKILFISVVFHFTSWLRNKTDLKSRKDTSLDCYDNANMPFKIEASWEIERVTSGTNLRQTGMTPDIGIA